MRSRRNGRHLARRLDPDTSKEAARIIADTTLGKKQQQALALLVEHPGSTSKELEQISGRGDGEVRKRLNDLRLAGRAHKGQNRKCRITNRLAYTWYPGVSRVQSLNMDHASRQEPTPKGQQALFGNPLPHESRR